MCVKTLCSRSSSLISFHDSWSKILKKGKRQTTEQEPTARAVSHFLSGRPCRGTGKTGMVRVWHGYGSFTVVTIVYSSNQGMRATLLSSYVGVERMAFGGAGV